MEKPRKPVIIGLGLLAVVLLGVMAWVWSGPSAKLDEVGQTAVKAAEEAARTEEPAPPPAPPPPKRGGAARNDGSQ